jgi:hypothetical protein
MRPNILMLIACMLALLTACEKQPDTQLCDSPAAGSALRFRITDASGNDYLHINKVEPEITQPCRTTPLVPIFITYEVPGTTDSGVLIHFLDMRTPELGEGSACFRIFFKWSGGNIDTLDWHYNEEESGGCRKQTISRVSYNGKDATYRNDGRYGYYVLVK